MSRSFAALDSSSESFSSIVERLSRKIDEGADLNSGGEYVSIAADVLAASRRTPAKLAVGKITSTGQSGAWGPLRKNAGATELSYEAALRKHGRSRAGAIPVKKPTVAAPKGDAENKSVTGEAIETATLAALQEAVITALGSTEVKGLKSPQKDKRQARQPGAHQSSDLKQRSVSANGGKNKDGRSRAPARHLKVGDENNRPGEAQIPLLTKGHESQERSSLQVKEDNQKRSTISIRISEQEAAVLRKRAEESGLSVSAYMRSCVMEAELLRAQVKQALADLRVASRIETAIDEPKALPALPSGGSTWSRFWSRSASFVFGPWYSSRRHGETQVVAKRTLHIMYGE